MPAAGARPKATKIYLIDCAWSRNLPKTQHTSYTHTLTLLKYFSSASHDSHFHTIWLVILYFYYFYIFLLFYVFPVYRVHVPFKAVFFLNRSIGSNGRSAEKGFFFDLWKNGITDVSLFASYCYFIQEARHRFRKKEINSLAQQTICLRTLNEQTLMRKSLCVYGRKFHSSSLGVCCLNEILCAPSFGGGLHWRFPFLSAVHMWNEIDCKRFLQSPLVVMSFWTTVVSRN